jgi:rare lipoprotein A
MRAQGRRAVSGPRTTRVQRLLAPICLVCLCAGCASAPPPREAEPSGAKPDYSRAAYNRPYTVHGRTYYPLASAEGYRERGLASWYGWESGRRTAMGSRFNPQRLTAAHRTLPLPTWVRVTNLRNGRSLEVLVNDRGPFRPGRLIDLSYGAARALKVLGLAPVEVRYIGEPTRAGASADASGTTENSVHGERGRYLSSR